MSTTKASDTPPDPEPVEPDVPSESDDPEVDAQATTTRTKDYAGRALANIATAGVDYLGRAIKAGNVDFMDRALVP